MTDRLPSGRLDEIRTGQSATSPPVFHVVTLSFNTARYIGETIESVVGQAGDFSIQYHVQDGGSSDGTLEIARCWQRRVETRDFPQACDSVHFTVESRPDGGMYDAIAAGFRRLAPASDDLMTWINSDDRLAPGALSAIATAFHDIPQIELVGGRHALMDALGRNHGTDALVAYPRSCIAAGLHDGRRLPFIQQEGTFWRARLWERTGGINSTFRLAGDFDLWRRFATEAEYVPLDAVTGYHRQRPGQLSADLDAYHREIDESSAEWMPNRDKTFRGYCNWHGRDRASSASLFSARVARRDAETGRWKLVAWQPPAPQRNVLHPIDGDWAIVCGFDPPEGPFPDLGLNTQFRWIVGRPATLLLFSALGGRRTVSLGVRSMVPRQMLKISIDGDPPHSRGVRAMFPAVEPLTVTHDFTPGPSRIEISIDRWMETAEGRRLGVIFDSVGFASDPLWRKWRALRFQDDCPSAKRGRGREHGQGPAQ